MPPKKCMVATVNFATRTITIDGRDVRCHTPVVQLESVSAITWTTMEPKTTGTARPIILEFKAFEEEMQPYRAYGVELTQFYQVILHADTIRKITLMRAFPGLAHEPGIVERIVQIMFANHLVTAYRGGYRKTAKCMERLQRLHDPDHAPVGSHAQYVERQRKGEQRWLSASEFEQAVHAIVSNTALIDREVEVELKKLRATAVQKNAPKEHVQRLDEEIKTYATPQSEVEHVKQQAKEIRTKGKQRAKIAKPSTKDVYIDDIGH